MLCPACKTVVPQSAYQCPACGTHTSAEEDRTQVVDDTTHTSVEDDRTQLVADKTQLVDATLEIQAAGWSKAFTTTDLKAYRSVSFVEGSLLGGRYEILATLGTGGMGSVFKAHDKEVDRIVALKVILPGLASSADILQRFRQELVLARQITHRNVVRIYDLAVADGIRFISMEYIEGQELAKILETRGKLPPKEAGEIMLQVCYGLSAAHQAGVVHRDLKPQNIMIDQKGRAAVMDFGIASSVTAAPLLAQASPVVVEGSTTLTRVGSLLGTPRYMSPEQARAEKLDIRTDIFTVGLILYELVVGKLPPMPSTLSEMLNHRATTQLPPPIEFDAQIPRALNDIIVCCTRLDPAERYQTIEELIHVLELWMGIRKTQISNWKLIPILSACVLLLAGVATYSFRAKAPAVAHAPVKILVSDFANQTGNPLLDKTLEPELSTALEEASFISTFNRGDARQTLAKLSGSTQLDENAARLIAQREGVGVVVAGSIRKDGSKYAVAAQAIDPVANKVIDSESAKVSSLDDLNGAVGRIAVGLRKALGDASTRSAKLNAAETFSSQSLAASQQYALAQELQWQGKWDQALQAYRRSIELDPGLGRAYSGMAVILANMGRKQDAENNFKLAMSKIDRMTDREKYRTRGAYYLMERNYDKAIEQFKALANQFPTDSAGIGNLALADFYSRNMTGAVQEERRVVDLNPNNVLYLNNYGLFAMYAGDFDTAIQESKRLLTINPNFEKAYICLGISELAKGDGAAAASAYQKAAPISTWGASASAVGLADMALYEGRPADAISILGPAVRADLAAKDTSRAAAKYAMQSQALLLQGQNAKAIAAAEQASSGSTDESLLYPAAMVFLQAGKADKAMELSQKLNQRLEPDPGAYSKLIEAEAQMTRKDYRDAVRTFQDAQKIADTWLGHFGLGRAYLEAGAFTEADSEFDACVKRRGEATAVFLDDEPSWRYFAPVYYYLGRTRQGLQSPGAADAYRNFLKIREKSTNDPLAKDAQERLRSLEAAH